MTTLPPKPETGVALTYNLRFLRQTKNYWVFGYGANLEGREFQVYIAKSDIDQPPAALQHGRMTVEF